MRQKSGSFNSFERKIVFLVSFIIFSRMAALFFPLPIFSPLASELVGATPFLVGVAIGIYALMQASLQIPLGWLSDKFGRKKIIFCGLILFFLGSVMCAMAIDINQLIFARFVQGLGAVSSTLSALISDQTRESQRAKAMAIVGASVGMAFFIGTIASSFIANLFGFSQIFWLISALAVISLIFAIMLPNSNTLPLITSQEEKNATSPLFSKKLIFLDISIFIGHFVLSANFFVIPLVLIDFWEIGLSEHWKIYLFVLAFSVPAMIFTVYLVDKAQKPSRAFSFALVSLIACHLLFFFHTSLAAFVIAMLIFFSGFGSLETILPTLTSKEASIKNKGLVMGVFSSSQQMGSALGSILAGWIGLANQEMIFLMNFVILTLWMGVSLQIARQFNLSKSTMKNQANL